MKSAQMMRVFDGDGELTILFRSVPFHPTQACAPFLATLSTTP